jgi:hypothetical protein
VVIVPPLCPLVHHRWLRSVLDVGQGAISCRRPTGAPPGGCRGSPGGTYDIGGRVVTPAVGVGTIGVAGDHYGDSTTCVLGHG